MSEVGSPQPGQRQLFTISLILPSLTRSFFPHSLTRSFFPHSLTRSFFPHSLAHSSLTHSLILPSLTHSFFPHSLTHSFFPHSLAHSFFPHSLLHRHPESGPLQMPATVIVGDSSQHMQTTGAPQNTECQVSPQLAVWECHATCRFTFHIFSESRFLSLPDEPCTLTSAFRHVSELSINKIQLSWTQVVFHGSFLTYASLFASSQPFVYLLIY